MITDAADVPSQSYVVAAGDTLRGIGDKTGAGSEAIARANNIEWPFVVRLGQPGKARIPDPRLDWLSAKFQPRKTTPADLEFLDTPGLLPTERRDNPRRLGILREAGGLLVVLNGFSEADYAGQLCRFRQELAFADLEIVTGRMGKLDEVAHDHRCQSLERLIEQNDLRAAHQRASDGQHLLLAA